ncbi:hypothetical protein KUTeg_021110 [Tegillarca granosa]|uniref:Uncharacterized protein n=1 Tax=Tegillarca granosa TaxID=220873 RepID=A0ABQ9E9W1_TEGGR|nr:hypothetical protein KUTeg_021110 [Tegillarca granosa]
MKEMLGTKQNPHFSLCDMITLIIILYKGGGIGFCFTDLPEGILNVTFIDKMSDGMSYSVSLIKSHIHVQNSFNKLVNVENFRPLWLCFYNKVASLILPCTFSTYGHN